MLYRKREKDIVDWLYNSDKALLITGARQIGKTYLIEETLKKQKANYIVLNLIERPEIISILKAVENTGINNFLAQLSLLTTQELIKGKTVIFFDEVQEYKEIVTLIKFLVQEGSFKYILSGSLLGVELNDLRSAPVGFLQTIDMYPMDFEEFCIALGLKQETLKVIQDCYEKCAPVDEFIHKRMIEAFYRYIVVGGMPEAVKTFIIENDYNKVSLVHNTIIPQYKRDFTKYEGMNKKLKIQKIYDLVPSEIDSKNKRYIFSNLDKNHRTEKYESSFEWLIHAGVALPVYNVTEPKLPLRLNEKSNLFKLFLSDVGLLMSIYGRGTVIKLLSYEKAINHGAMFENVVAQELMAHGYDVYYFSSKKQGEIDFVIEHNGQCLPIEVKSGKDYKIHSALNNILSNEGYQIPKAYVFSNGNVSKEGKILYLPIYMIMFLKKETDELPLLETFDLRDL